MKNLNKRLRVVHLPQIPCDGFKVEVKNEREAYLIEETLAQQHLFLLEHNIIPDYSNVICIEMWDEEMEADENGDKWCDYHNEEEGMDWDELKDTYEEELK